MLTLALAAALIAHAGQPYHGDELKAEGGPGWLALYADPGSAGYALRRVTVTVATVKDAVVDEGDTKTGKQLDIAGDAPDAPKPLYLFKDVPGLLPGAVRGPTNGVAVGFVYPGQTVLVEAGDAAKMLALYAVGKAVDADERGQRARITDYSLKVARSSGGAPQVLDTRAALGDGVDTNPGVVWAGDLDGDGYADLVLDLSNHYNVSHLALYLSSAAKAPDILKRVAELRTTGC